MRAVKTALLTVTMICAAAVAAPTEGHAIDVYVNGVKATGLKGADLSHCQVKFDALGNLHIISPGYRVITDKTGKPVRIAGSSDFGNVKPTHAKPTQRYVLLYRPHPKVPYSFTITVNGKKFKEIALTTSAFTVDLTAQLHRGPNQIRVTGKPVGAAPANGTDRDVARLTVLTGTERADGAFVAKHPPVWEFVRAAIDRTPVSRSSTLIAK